jgi:cystathionine beta-lyase/cystathionine gamma-synthase
VNLIVSMAKLELTSNNWGGFESLAMPSAGSLNDGNGLRLHVGLEAVHDLIADLEAAFEVFARTASERAA